MDFSNLEFVNGTRFIPAKEKSSIFDSKHKFRVCAYCRVSTDREEQLTSFELQKEHYENLAGQHPNWNLMHIFADEGISGTSLKNRVQFNEMIRRCEAGEFDLIVTKSVSRFARNLVDCISLVRRLKNHNPPVGVFFETDNLFTLSEESEFKLSMLASFAQEESIKKSESMNWSLRERFKSKKVLNPELYGYRRPRDSVGRLIKYSKLEIYEPEAVVVRFMFNAVLAGFTLESIADVLSENEIPTKLGNTKWTKSALLYILTNERYCGSILTWKTFTYDVFEHRKKRNVQERDQYLYMNMHDPIVSVEQYEAVQKVLANYKRGMRGGLHYMHVVNMGVFQGYVPINHHWANDDPTEYFNASNSVPKAAGKTQMYRRSQFSAFDLRGYQVVREQFLTSRTELPCLTFANDKIALNGFTLRKLSGESHVQLLLHPTERKLAIRPCEGTDHFSIPITKRTGATVAQKSLSCEHFNKMLYQIMGWNPDYSYKIVGTWIEKENDKLVIFNLSNAMPSAVLEPEEDGGRRTKVKICPEEWVDSFGSEFYDFALENDLYYLPDAAPLSSDAKSTAIPSEIRVPVMPTEAILEEAQNLRLRKDSSNE